MEPQCQILLSSLYLRSIGNTNAGKRRQQVHCRLTQQVFSKAMKLCRWQTSQAGPQSQVQLIVYILPWDATCMLQICYPGSNASGEKKLNPTGHQSYSQTAGSSAVELRCDSCTNLLSVQCYLLVSSQWHG